MFPDKKYTIDIINLICQTNEVTKYRITIKIFNFNIIFICF